jgi:hypothetical protein
VTVVTVTVVAVTVVNCDSNKNNSSHRSSYNDIF